MTKKVLSIQDISCVGRCSLTAALPIISSYGVECRVLPTALLSTHTGGFAGYTYLDLTAEMEKILAAWQPLHLHFDAIYSGFMASAAQIDVLKTVITTYPALTVIDPVMADNGALYSVFDENFVIKMRELLPLADVLTPNITEACLLTGTPYRELLDKDFVKALASGLQNMGAKNLVLTGVKFDRDHLGAASVTENGDIDYHFTDSIPGTYHGTGDMFASVLTAQLVRSGRLDKTDKLSAATLTAATKKAIDFVVAVIKATPAGADLRYGVNFEEVLAERGKNDR